MKIDIYNYRFGVFLLSQLGILFGSLFFPFDWFYNMLLPVLFLVNLFAGILLMRNRPTLKRLLIVLIICSAVVLGFNIALPELDLLLVRITINFLFYILVSFELITQVWKAHVINTNVMAGLISGYISLGFLGYFICMSIEILSPGSYTGIPADAQLSEAIMYYTYITLLTIGYGDILPVTPIAQKAAVFIGLMGQMYLVVLTAIVVGKYINQISGQEKE